MCIKWGFKFLGGSILGVKFLDPLAGVVVSGMILKAGLETGYQRFVEFINRLLMGLLNLPYQAL